MTMKNSHSRIAKRRKVSLAIREKNLAHWRTQFVGDALAPENKEVLRKIALAESEVLILKKLTGTL